MPVNCALQFRILKRVPSTAAGRQAPPRVVLPAVANAAAGSRCESIMASFVIGRVCRVRLSTKRGGDVPRMALLCASHTGITTCSTEDQAFRG